MGVDWQTDGAKVPEIADFRKRAGTVGAKPNTTATLQKGVLSYDTPKETNGFKPLQAKRALQRPHAELEELARAARWVTLSIMYSTINQRRPDLSSDRHFNGGHSVGMLGRRESTGKVEYLIFDPLADGRKEGYPRGPKWWPRGLVFAATEAFAKKADSWTGLIQFKAKAIEEPEPPEPPTPPDPPVLTPEELIKRLTAELDAANKNYEAAGRTIDELESRIALSIATLQGATLQEAIEDLEAEALVESGTGDQVLETSTPDA
jgi:hypothetical protein